MKIGQQSLSEFLEKIHDVVKIYSTMTAFFVFGYFAFGIYIKHILGSPSDSLRSFVVSIIYVAGGFGITIFALAATRTTPHQVKEYAFYASQIENENKELKEKVAKLKRYEFTLKRLAAKHAELKRKLKKPPQNY